MESIKTFIFGLFLIIVIFNSFISKGQENNCVDTHLYKAVLKELNLYDKKAADIEFGYKPDKSVINIIDKLRIFDEKEMSAIKGFSSKEINYSTCDSLNKEIKLILDPNKIRKNGSYIKYIFSDVISISESKKFILMFNLIKNKKYEGGKAIGGEIMYIFNFNGKEWILTDKKMVSMY